MIIKTKKQFYELSFAGKIGNSVNQFRSIREARDAGWTDTLSFRYTIPQSPYLSYKIPNDKLEEVMSQLVAKGAKEDLFIVSENPDDQRILLQAEFGELPNPYLRYSFIKDIQRKALATESFVAENTKAIEICRHFMDAASFDNFQRLRDEYPYHIIEFTIYDYVLGTENQNTIFWEVRMY